MKANFFENLESRRMMSFTAADMGSPWIVSSDANGSIATNNETGKSYKLPTVRPDGSANLEGTTDADNILIERVTGLTGGNTGDDILRQVTLLGDEPNSRFVTGGNMNAAELEARAERERGLLVERQARVEELLNNPPAEGEPRYGYDQTLEMAKQSVKTSQGIIELMTNLAQATREIPTTDFMHYRLEGVYDIYVEIPAGASTAGKIVVDAKSGNDNVTVATNVPMKVSINGGDGSDSLTSGKKTANLYGGGGNDRLVSRSERGGILDGGKGADRYYNRFGEVQITAKADGDRLVLGDRSVIVSKSGVFGTSNIDGRSYFMVSGVAGQVDLLA